MFNYIFLPYPRSKRLPRSFTKLQLCRVISTHLASSINSTTRNASSNVRSHNKQMTSHTRAHNMYETPYSRSNNINRTLYSKSHNKNRTSYLRSHNKDKASHIRSPNRYEVFTSHKLGIKDHLSFQTLSDLMHSPKYIISVQSKSNSFIRHICFKNWKHKRNYIVHGISRNIITISKTF